MNVTKAYKSMLGYEPYDYQRKMAEKVLQGRNILLRAPTGAGKTVAVTVPFVLGKNNASFPSKLVYSLPLRTLANSIYATLQALIPNGSVSIQTGEYPQDPLFLSRAVVATIDQSLSAWLGIPIATPEASTNINYAVFPSSYLVFDEVHIMDPERSFVTMSALLDMFPSRFALMTATMTDLMLGFLSSKLGAEVVDVTSSSELRSEDKTRRVYVEEQELTSDLVLQHHKQKTIVICNTVAQAQKVYDGLIHSVDHNTRVVLLHSRFLQHDRAQKEKALQQYFAKGSSCQVILVATQVIEVGIDISCDTMLTELAPADSLVQRFGRCARYPGEVGEVYVCRLPHDDKGTVQAWPYRNHREVIERTWQVLEPMSGSVFTWEKTLQFINEALTERDQRITENLDNKIKQLKNQLGYEIGRVSPSYSELVRQVNSLNVSIIDASKTHGNYYRLESVSISPGILKAYARQNGTQGLYSVVTVDSEEGQDAEQHLQPIDTVSDIDKHYRIFLDKNIASYTSDRGFELGTAGSYVFNEIPTKGSEQKIVFKEEEFLEHSRRCLEVFDSIRGREFDYYAAVVAQECGIPVEQLESLIELVISCHDIGKLQPEWQSACVRSNSSPKYLAHSQGRRRRPPSHAAAGPTILANVLRNWADSVCGLKANNMLLAVVWAMAHHHSARTNEFSGYALDKGALQQVVRAAKLVGWNTDSHELLASNTGIQGLAPVPSCNECMCGFQLYSLLARTLRICDRLSQV